MELPEYLKRTLRELKEERDNIWDFSKECTLCGRKCKVDRDKEKGVCGIGSIPLVSSYGLHFGEEPELVGTGGSGTVFFAGCNLKCIFCQNYEISWNKEGVEITIEELSGIFLTLQREGAHNINLVSPTHVIHFIVDAIILAREKGLSIPVVYNTGGYDNPELIKHLNKFIDIYMPDAKYGDDDLAKELSGVSDYVEINRKNLIEMYRQRGNLKISNGVAEKGVIIRHLVLPGLIDNSIKVLDFIAKNLSPDVYLNIMGQYWPAFKAKEHPIINRRVTLQEIKKVRNYWLSLGGTTRGWREEFW